MRKKKASLNISVEAIIIIILAITILGLGLGFIRGMFGQVATQFEEMVENEPEPPSASSSQPITLSRESIVTEPGEEQALKIGFYHTGAAGPSPPGDCTGLDQPNCALYTAGCTWGTDCQPVTGKTPCSELDEDDCKSLGCNWDTDAATPACSNPSAGTYHAVPELNCGSGVINDAVTQSSAKNVNLRDRVVMSLIFQIDGNAPEGNKLCSIQVGRVEKDITIRIK